MKQGRRAQSRAPHPYPEFAAAVRAIAPTVDEIARCLDVSKRSVAGYLAGTALPRAEVLKSNPRIDDALSRDFQSKIRVMTCS